MMNKFKYYGLVVLLSQTVLLAGAQANDPMADFYYIPETMNAYGGRVPNPECDAFEERYASAVDKMNNRSYSEQAWDVMKAGSSAVGRGALSAAQWAGDKIGRNALAYGVSYLAPDYVAEGFAYTAYGVGTLVGGPGGGSAAYTAVKGVYNMSKYIPGADGGIALMATPYTKYVTDAVIDYGPSVATAAYNGASYAYNTVSDAASSVYNYWSY